MNVKDEWAFRIVGDLGQESGEESPAEGNYLQSGEVGLQLFIWKVI